VLLALGAFLAVAASSGQASVALRTRGGLLAVFLALASLATFDALQKSLLALVVLGLGMAWLAWRLSAGGPSGPGQLEAQLKVALGSRWVQAGVVVLVLFAAGHGLRTTEAVIGDSLGIWSGPTVPVLLFVSIVQGYLATGLLFALSYPLLPFRQGYLKAVALALWLLLIFLVGVGSDERLVSTLPTLVVGRLVYYLSIPLLIGLFLDIEQFRTGQPAGDKPGPLTFGQAASTYLKRVQGQLGAVSAIAVIVVPRVFALVSGQPLLTSYFDLLQQLLKAPG
jgi:hypothetical protein